MFFTVLIFLLMHLKSYDYFLTDGYSHEIISRLEELPFSFVLLKWILCFMNFFFASMLTDCGFESRCHRITVFHHADLGLNPKRNIRFFVGRQPWSSGYGRRLMFERSWVQILAPCTGWLWHFLNWFVFKKYYCLFEKD